MPDIQTSLTTLTQGFSIEPASLARAAEKRVDAARSAGPFASNCIRAD